MRKRESFAPEPSALLSRLQKDGKPLGAVEIYASTWDWLNNCGCADCVPSHVLERYAMSAARWMQCEEYVSEYGLLAKMPAGNAVSSPYVTMSQNYLSQANKLWQELYQTVKEHLSDDPEQLTIF